jgi:Flp pilus assembly protein TadG
VEFALVLPLLLLVMLALVQVGVLARDRLIVEQAARAGAREAAVEGDTAAITAVVIAAAIDLDPSSIRVSIDDGGARGEPVTVSVTYAVPVGLPLAGWLFPSSVEISATATMRREYT